MAKDYTALTRDISAYIGELRRAQPEPMQAFSALAKTASDDGAVDKKTKELIALAIGVAVRCDGCIGFHMQALLKLGASKAEIEETLGMAVYMGGGPSLMYAANAVAAFDQVAPDQVPAPAA